MVTGSSPIFVASDILETVRFYKEVLGFTSSWTWGEPPTFGAATIGKVTVMFGLNPELAAQSEGQGHWFDVENVNGLHAKHQALGADIISPIDDKPWGRREYTVRDINGYHLRFAGDPVYVPRGTGVFPPDISIVRRKPTPEEHQRLDGGSTYEDETLKGILDRTWKAVVAVTSSGEVIGTARIMFDAPGWFSIWDVNVFPEWQNQRIGTALIEAALEIIREESPGAFAYLFTYKHGFYERIGFGKETVSMRKV